MKKPSYMLKRKYLINKKEIINPASAGSRWTLFKSDFG